MVEHGIGAALPRRAGTQTAHPIGNQETVGEVLRRRLAAFGRAIWRRPLGDVARADGATDAELARIGRSTPPTPEDVPVHALLYLYGGTPPRA